MASTKRRIGRGAGIALVIALSLSTLSACSSGRSVEAYCDVLSTHKDRYLSAMNEVNTTDDFLASLTGAVGAFGEISQMWDEAAKVAPTDIQSDVEAVRDFWDGQLETAKEMINDPLGGLASAFMEAASNSGAVERVDAYTATNCPSVGAMFFTTEAAPPEEEETTPEPETSATQAEPVSTSVVEYEYGWNPQGPFMAYYSEWALPGEETFTLDLEQLLYTDDVQETDDSYVIIGSDPFVVGFARIRIPASGLVPEHDIYSLVSVDPSSPDRIAERVDLDEPGMLSLFGTTSDGIIVLELTAVRDKEYPHPSGTVAVDMATGDVAWRTEGQPIEVFDGVVLVNKRNTLSPGTCPNDDILVAYDANTGKELWRNEATSEPCVGPQLKVGQFSNAYVSFTTVETPREVFLAQSLTTGAITTIPLDSASSIYIDPVSTLIMGSRPGEESYELAAVDAETGDVVYTLDGKLAQALRLEVVSLYDKKLYVETTDEKLIIDLRSGEEVGTWTRAPLRPIDDWVWMSDSTLRKATDISGE